MTKNDLKALFCLVICTLALGCTIQKPQTTFKAYDLNPKLDGGQYGRQLDNFMVILDASASMAEPYKGLAKFKVAKDIVSRMNQTIPTLKLNAALRTFGNYLYPFRKRTALVYRLTPYAKSGFEDALKTIKRPGGKSPLAVAIDAATEDLKSTQGKTAVIILSDGSEMDNAPILAAENMKKRLGDRLCIYPVLVGDHPAGKQLMDQIARAGRCGFTVTADRIASSQTMADFVEKVFLAKLSDMDRDGVNDNLDQCPHTPKEVKVDARGCPLDTDGDGVYDYLDHCPHTPKRAKVNARGCPPDTDGDGVYDFRDQCPGTPKGVKVNKTGCPLDTDSDGVYDYIDQCPGTPVGVEVNEKGCWVLEGIQFESRKWTIEPQAYPILDEVVAVMKENPGVRVEVQGHTDNVGSEADNRKLSKNRARAVMEYLVKKGVDKKRLSSAGYGFARPIASNDTTEGRAQNRRVELMPIR